MSRPIGCVLALGLAIAGCGDDESTRVLGPGTGASTPSGGAGGAGGFGATGGTGGAGGVAGGAGAGATGAAAGSGGAGGSGGEPLIDGRPVSPLYGQVVFNEVLTDGTAEGDPNGDGDSDPVEDQFVELVHLGTQTLALDGFTLVERDFSGLARHTFGSSDSVAPAAAIVVFGGGDGPEPTATTTFYVANAEDPGLPFGLDLSVPTDTMWLLDADERVVARFCYGGEDDCSLEAATDESVTRSPDITGDFAPHTTATGSNGASFSAGTRVDGSSF